jgi:hypothetical protein
MLPDFATAKHELLRRISRAVDTHTLVYARLLKDVHRFRQHEGAAARLNRSEGSQATIDYRELGFEFKATREDMRNPDPARLIEMLSAIAKHFAEEQEREMLDKVSAAAEEAGNVVKGGAREITPEVLFELLRTVEMEFDPATEELSNTQYIVVPPSAAEVLARKFEEWNADPALKAEHDRIIAEQREKWRVRENRRALVD